MAQRGPRFAKNNGAPGAQGSEAAPPVAAAPETTMSLAQEVVEVDAAMGSSFCGQPESLTLDGQTLRKMDQVAFFDLEGRRQRDVVVGLVREVALFPDEDGRREDVLKVLLKRSPWIPPEAIVEVFPQPNRFLAEVDAGNWKEVRSVVGAPIIARLLLPGDAYGLEGCLAWEHEEPGLEFYDASQDQAKFGPFGQFTGGRYYLGTLLESFGQHAGLVLQGGVPEWSIPAREKDAAIVFAVNRADALLPGWRQRAKLLFGDGKTVADLDLGF